MRCLTIFLVFVFCHMQNALPQSSKVVFSYDKNATPLVRIDRFEPIAPGLKAILAMYALQNDAGCTGGYDTLRCALTDALDVGAQCSSHHVALVKSWFVTEIPKMSEYADQAYKSNFENICYKTPDGATSRELWSMIRIAVNGSYVAVDARGHWTSRGKRGMFTYVTKYKIEKKAVKVVSHRKL